MLNISDWQLAVDQTWERVNTDSVIGNLSLPYTFTRPTVYYLISTQSPGWYKGGFLQQVFNLPYQLSGAGILESLFVQLDKPTLHTFNTLNTSYSLQLDVPIYFFDVTVKIWEYTL